MKNIRASIAMAVYNGEQYLKEQLDSILSMISLNDEIIISYNSSTDRTLKIIRKYEMDDSRIHVVVDEGNSVETNFNNAIKYCRGDYIFLCDQDDIWINDKVNCVVEYFINHPETKIVVSNGFIGDKHLKITGNIFSSLHTSSSVLRNYIKGTYLGCQMAFRKELQSKVFPVPVVYPPLAHDLWLGVFGGCYGRLSLIEEKLIIHRQHNSNVSKKRKMSLYNVIKNRTFFLFFMIKRGLRNYLSKNRK